VSEAKTRLLDAEKAIGSKLLRQLLTRDYADSLLRSLYPHGATEPRFLRIPFPAVDANLQEPQQGSPQASRKSTEDSGKRSSKGDDSVIFGGMDSPVRHAGVDATSSVPALHESLSTQPTTILKWAKLYVTNIPETAYVSVALSNVKISVTHANGDPIIDDNSSSWSIPIRFTVHNKWTDVSDEVVENHDQLTVLEIRGSSLVLPDVIFREVSVHHGGYFEIQIRVGDGYDSEIQSFRRRINVMSLKAKKRRRRAGNQRD